MIPAIERPMPSVSPGPSRHPRRVLITGSNSGLGFEAAALFAKSGFDRVVLACRTLEKAEGARVALMARTDLDVFEPLCLDVADISAVRKACDGLVAAGAPFDAIILNAGVLPGAELVRTPDGLEVAAAASLVGHHVLTLRLLRAGLLRKGARIVIAGSEGARGEQRQEDRGTPPTS